MFVNGDLRGKFIMDRNLGARDTNWHSDGKGALTYQFGRKDPVAGGASVNTTTAYIARGDNGEEDRWIFDRVTGPVKILTSVNNPMIYYLNNINWCSDVTSENYIWHDFEADASSNDKSIYDPSPYGWKVPPIGVWDGFTTNDDVQGMTDWVYYSEETPNIGRSYPRDNPFAYYPSTGYRNWSAGAVTGFSTSAYLWNSTGTTAYSCYYNRFNTESAAIMLESQNRPTAQTIRPVQHNE